MAVTVEDIKTLREMTGCGMMDCRKALAATDCDMEAAVTELRKQGLATAAKKSVKATSAGCVGSYLHAGGKIGVLVELQCETDFVAMNAEFQTLLKDICMQVAATSPLAVSADDIDPETLERERGIYRQQALDSGKPEKIVEKIVEGRLKAFTKEQALLEQPFVKDPDVTIAEHIAGFVGKIGENIRVARFVRMQLGEAGD